MADDKATQRVSLEEMITHDKLLERYPWLSAQIVNRWRRQKAIRSFRGHKGMMVYVRSDIERAISADMDAYAAEMAAKEAPR